MKPVRVLHVVTKMDKGGLESRLMDIIRHIDANKIIIDIYTNRIEQGYFDNEIASLGGRIYYNSPISPFRLYKKVLEFYRFMKMHREYSIVHVHMNEWSTLFCIGARMAGVPVRIAHSRGANTELSVSRFVKDIVRLPIKKNATDFFAVSIPAAIKLFGKRAYINGRVKIWPNAIDCWEFAYKPEVRLQMRTRLGLNNAFTVMHVGNFTTVKNQNFLLEIFDALKKKERRAKLVFIGGGSLEKYINKTTNLGLASSVLFLGSRSDVADLLQAADVFVFPSFHEGFPGAVLEAQAAGLPCIISDTITKEVCLLPTTTQLPLSLPPEKWADVILASKNVKRKDTCHDLVAMGYDIVSLTKELTEFYEKSVGEGVNIL